MRKMTMYEVCSTIHSTMPREALFKSGNGDVTECRLWLPIVAECYSVWRRGDTYGVVSHVTPPRKIGEYTPEKPGIEKLAGRLLLNRLPLPHVKRCFGYKENGNITGIVYLPTINLLQDGLARFQTPGSSLFRALPGNRPRTIKKFWKLVANKQLVDITDKVAYALYVEKMPGGVVVCVDNTYYAHVNSLPAALQSPEQWFHENRLSRRRFNLGEVLKTRIK